MTQRKQRTQRPRRTQRKRQPERNTTPDPTTSAPAGTASDAASDTATDTIDTTANAAATATATGTATGTVTAVDDDTAKSLPHKGSDATPGDGPDSNPDPEQAQDPDPDSAPVPPQAATAFDALYTRHVTALIRQVYLLTGRPRLSQEAVERAFQLAWQRWPEVAVDPDPAGWVRAAAYEYALSPWHRLRPGHRSAEKTSPKAPAPPPAAPEDRALLDTVLGLPAPYRRALLLHDGVGLGLYETAAEVEASTPAAAGRLTHARETVAERLPELGLGELPPVRQGEILHARLTELAAAQPVAPPEAPVVRGGSEQLTRRTTRAALGLTALIALATVIVLFTTPNGYTPQPKEPAGTAPASPAAAPSGAAASPGGRPGHGGGGRSAEGAGGAEPVPGAGAPFDLPSPGPENPAVQELPQGARLVPQFR
jgi:DNA-directed RNA polymerase specialized sigma24 family protein